MAAQVSDIDNTWEKAWEAAQNHRVLSGPLNTIQDLANDPFFNKRGAFSQVDHPQTGPLNQPGRPFIMSETPWTLRRPAPLLGQHNKEVLTELGYETEDIIRLRELGVI